MQVVIFCLLIFAVLIKTDIVPQFFVTLYLILSAITFIAYGLDKWLAKTRQYRMPEKTLHFFGLVGGWPGGLIAQQLFHHKTTKLSFQIGFWITVTINCLVFFLLYHHR